MDTLLQDIRFGLRTLFKNKGFTFVAVLTLALAIGANTAIFSIVNPLLLQGLPVANPSTLVLLGDPSEVHGRSHGTPQTTMFSYPLYKGLTENSAVFSSAFASGDIRRLQVSNSANDPGQPANGRLVTGDYFSVLGIPAALGRLFEPSEMDLNHPAPIAVISYAYWQRQFNGDHSVIGREIRLSGVPITIIGVAQRGFEGEIASESQDFFVPMSMQPQLVAHKSWNEDPQLSWLQVMARLKPGVTRAQAEASVNVTFQQMLNGAYGASLNKDDHETVVKEHIPVAEGARGFSTARDAFGRPLVLLMIIVGLVLVMACTNISNMLLARSSSRSREIALRVAIGASPWRVVRQLVTESLFLAVLGGIAGLAVAQWGTHLLLRWVSVRYTALVLDTSLDARVLGFAAILCVITGLLFGLVPAFRALKVELTSILGNSTRVSASHSFGRFFSVGNLLVAAQFAVSMLVITGARLLVRSLYNLEGIDLGYSRDQLLVMKTDPISVGFTPEHVQQIAREAPEAFASIPGVRGATVSEDGLFSGTDSDTDITVDGYTSNNKDDLQSHYDHIGSNYFSTIGARLLLGRDLTERDNGVNNNVAVINETMAHFYFKDGNAIGHKFNAAGDDRVMRSYEIVGVVRDVRDHSVRKPVDRRFYIPFLNGLSSTSIVNFEIRTTGDPNIATSAIRQKLAQVAPGLPIVSVQTLDDLAQRQVFQESMLARLSGLFGVLALVLAAVGLYGLMSYMVVVRTKDIGIRIALGAQRSDILKSILKQAFVLAVTGVGVGIPIALLCGYAMRTTLYEVGASDPVSLISSMLVLAVVALGSSLVPAIAAMRVDPIIALRYE